MGQQHKVIVRIIEDVPVSSHAWNGVERGKYERVYPSKSAAVNNAREIGKAKVFGYERDKYGNGHPRFRYGIHVEDMAGNDFNHVWRGGCDIDSSDLTADVGIALLKARGFTLV